MEALSTILTVIFVFIIFATPSLLFLRFRNYIASVFTCVCFIVFWIWFIIEAMSVSDPTAFGTQNEMF